MVPQLAALVGACFDAREPSHSLAASLPQRSSPPAPVQVPEAAAALARMSLAFFGSYYFRPIIPGPIPAFHRRFLALMEDPGAGNLLLYWPRGHSKSTWATTIFPLWRKLNGEPFSVIISETDDQAIKLFRDFKVALENLHGEYDRLHQDFGPALAIRRSNDHELEFADGSAIYCKAAGSSSRGLKHHGKRPGLIVIDDLEEERAVRSPTQRKDTWEWYTRTIKPMPDPTRGRIVWVGTLLHEDASMPRAEASGAYRVVKERAIIQEPTNTALWDEWDHVWEAATLRGEVGKDVARAFYTEHQAEMDVGVEVLWPERFPYIALMETKREMAAAAFSMEFNNAPAALENQLIPKDCLVDFTIVPVGTETLLRDDRGQTVPLAELTLVLAVDPAISQKTTADYFAAIVLGCHPTGTRWVLDLVRGRYPIHEQVQLLLDLFATWTARAPHRVLALGIETVAYQDALRQSLDRALAARGLSFRVTPLRPVADKLLRLGKWEPTFAQRLVRIQLGQHRALVDELTGFTRDGTVRPPHDDTVDALTYALDLAEQVARGRGHLRPVPIRI